MTPEAFAYYEEHEAELRTLVRGALGGIQTDRVDALMSDVILVRLPRILRDYNPDLGELRPYVNTNLRWYVFKALKSEDKHRLRYKSMGDGVCWNETGQYEDHDARLDAVAFDQRLRAYLSRDQYRILHRRYAQGLLMKEIAAKMGVGKVTCWMRFTEAIETARKMKEP